MDFSLHILLLLNLAFIGILPRIFFRADGRFNWKWWMTAFPFLLATISVFADLFGYLSAMILYQGQFQLLMSCVTVVMSVGSAVLMAFTLGTHRIPLALWHQNNDQPKEIVTWGAYKRIRHPFYSSFLLCLIAAFFLVPHLLTGVALIYGFLILNYTAAKEEQKLSQSAYGDHYVAYIRSTGRFFPKVRS